MTLDGKIYKTTSEMADKWHIDSKIIAKFCRKNVIVDKKKIKNKWYISENEPYPFDEKQITQILMVLLRIKNNPSQEVNWNEYGISDDVLSVIGESLYKKGYILSIKKKTPFKKYILTNKGLNLVFESAVKIDDYNQLLANVANYFTIAVGILAMVPK